MVWHASGGGGIEGGLPGRPLPPQTGSCLS